MKAMVLAAGLGKRLRPLTDSLPKPLLEVSGKPLLVWHLLNIKRAGIREVVINVHHLAQQIQSVIGDGREFDLDISYSVEPKLLETGGGIKHALPLLGDAPFLVVSADTFIEFEFSALVEPLPEQILGKLLMTKNPTHHPEGDFAIAEAGRLAHQGDRQTYTGIGVLRPDLVSAVEDNSFALRQVFNPAIDTGLMLGVSHPGYWCDVGTLERLESLRTRQLART